MIITLELECVIAAVTIRYLAQGRIQNLEKQTEKIFLNYCKVLAFAVLFSMKHIYMTRSGSKIQIASNRSH